ncbi:Trigger factor-like protein TIG [Zostera marina]|uniref:peptidylprolyl isomerase n=1 Tax=Zostera marina TaxID=29655 RepID=A0A0K9Q1B7_ZOSMR|nr:Trigger factor-like protein TIG [Zostera marina]
MELTTVSLRSFRIPSNPSFLSSAFAPTRLVLVRSTSPYLKISSQLGKIKPLSKKLKVSEKTVTNEVEKEILSEDVLVIETKQPNSSVLLNVEVTPAICQDCYKNVIDGVARRSKIPGFRPGKKVPENILVNYVGRDQLQRATIESILKRTLPSATSSMKGRVLKDSIRIVTKFSEMNESFSLQNSLRYDVVADVAPVISWSSEYKNMKIVVEIDNIINAEVACELEIKRRHKAMGALKIVTDRGLEVGDLVVLDIFAKKIKEDASEGESIPSAERIGFHFDTEEANNLLPGFLDSILGARQGETKIFNLLFPESWEQENLQGVNAGFTVVCKEIFYRELPALDDSTAEKLLPGSNTLSEVRESILEKCREMEQDARDQATDNAILRQLREIVELEIPQTLFEEQGRQLYGAKLLQIQANQKLDEQQLAFLTSEKTVKEYLESQRANVSNIIKQMLAVGEIFKCENLQFSTEEMVKEVENSLAEFKRHNQDYDEERVKDQVQEMLEGAKVLEWLRENSDIQYVDV